MSTPTLHRTLWLTSAYALSALFSAPALAQTYSYAKLLTYQPAIADSSNGSGTPNHGNPSTMNGQGQTMGWATVRSGSIFDFKKFKYVPAYKRVVLKWAETPSGDVSPTVVSTTVMPLHMNDVGSWVGYIPSQSLVSRDKVGFGYLQDKAAIQINGKVTEIKYGSNGLNFEVKALNNKNWVLGTTLVESATSAVLLKGLIWKAGVFTELETGGAEYSYAIDMNNNGDVVGRLQTNVLYDSGPLAGTLKEIQQQAALWVNGKLAWRGPMNSAALSINAAGDVLWRSYDTYEQFIRRNGVDTVVPVSGRLTGPGTVYGCISVGDSSFASEWAIWKDGQTIRLAADMQAQGLTPPRTNDCSDARLIDVQAGKLLYTTQLFPIGTTRPSALSYLRVHGMP